MSEAPVPDSASRAPRWFWICVGASVLAGAFVLLLSLPFVDGLLGKIVTEALLSDHTFVAPQSDERYTGGVVTPARIVEHAFRSYALDHAGNAPASLDELLRPNTAGARPYLADLQLVRDEAGQLYDYRRSATPNGWRVTLARRGATRAGGGDPLDAGEVVFEFDLPRD